MGKMARVKKKKRGMTKFSFVTQPRHFVLHIPNTPPHHHLCSQKARRDRLRQFEKKKHASTNARNARPILSLHDRTSVIKKKKKKSHFLPHLKTLKKKISPRNKTHPKKSNDKKTLCIISCECVCPINIEEKNTPKVTHGWPSARESNSDDLEYVLVCVLELYMIYSLCNSVNLINSTLIFALLFS